MTFLIKEIQNKDVWENFLLSCNEKTFLSSWNWGEFNKLMGNKIWRLGVFEGNELIGVALVNKISAKRGEFLFVAQGPATKSKAEPSVSEARREKKTKFSATTKNQKSKILEVLLDQLKRIAKEEKVSFIRIAPIWEKSEENIKVFKDLDFKEAPLHIHPEVTWELDIRPPEEELLRRMRKTTRYLIRQAQQNKEIGISQSQKLDDIEIFHKLYQEVVARQHFTPFALDYLKNEFSAFNSDNQISIFLGKYQDEIVASGIFIFWLKIGFYHHGASSLKYPKIPVSYLLEWEAIKEAKRRKCQTFNFWGIAPKETKDHPWAGLTLFKKGFGGYKKEYVKTQDLLLLKKYYLTYIFEKLRKTKRGL